MQEKNLQTKECDDLRTCAYNNWYEQFSKITLRSNIVCIPKHIIDYLLDEIIILPKECYENQIDVVDEEDDALNTPQPEFPEFSQMLSRIIKELGGSVFIKTNWHSPKDAFWITAGQTMCCKDITDIYQLLKASSICKEDLNCHDLPLFADTISTMNATDTNQYLVMKKWHDIHPGTEFRCFVRNKRIVGISPRDWPQYHEHICAQKIDIINDIVSMFKEQIKYRFPLDNYVFDVVRDCKDHVYLLDFAPFGEKWTEPLAFEWADFDKDNKIVENDSDEEPEFRYLSSSCGIQPSTRNNYGVPKDVIDMFRASSSGENAQLDDNYINDDRPHGSIDQNELPENTLDHFINNRLETIFRTQPQLEDNDNDE